MDPKDGRPEALEAELEMKGLQNAKGYLSKIKQTSLGKEGWYTMDEVDKYMTEFDSIASYAHIRRELRLMPRTVDTSYWQQPVEREHVYRSYTGRTIKSGDLVWRANSAIEPWTCNQRANN